VAAHRHVSFVLSRVLRGGHGHGYMAVALEERAVRSGCSLESISGRYACEPVEMLCAVLMEWPVQDAFICHRWLVAT
jgi:hypothetical protein